MMDIHKNELEELSKKSFEVVVHLNCKAMPNFSSDSESDLSDTQDEDGRPLCNTWKGHNHDLHVVGKFKSDFDKRLKTYQVPHSVPLSMDTFCRVEANYPKGDPLIDEAFLLWESPLFAQLLPNEKQRNKNDKLDQDSSESEENLEDSSSETESEIGEYIKAQKMKKIQGESVTGESLIFDEDHDIIRNLHAASISLTSYGGIPDEKIFGKTEILFDQLSPEEKSLLIADADKKYRPTLSTNNVEVDDKVMKGSEQKQAETGSGDSVVNIQNKL